MRIFTAAQLLEVIGDGELLGDPHRKIRGIAPLEKASEGEATFLFKVVDPALVEELGASVVILPKVAGLSPGSDKTLIMVDSLLRAMASLLHLFAESPFDEVGVSPLAFISSEVKLGEEVTVYPFAFIDREAEIGDRSVIMPYVFIGRGARLGQEVVVFPGVVIYPGVIVEERVVIHAGAVIGSDGFGYVEVEGKRVKIPQIGRVRVEDEVEIGANTCVDRATLGETTIGKGTKLDNLIQIGHNTVVGKDCAFAGQVGISGSVKVGDRVLMGGQVGVADHVKIGNDAKIAARAGIMANLEKGSVVSGAPAMPINRWKRIHASLVRLPDLSRRFRRLERIVEHFKGEGP